MKTKGKKKKPAIPKNIPQEKALEFDAKWRSTPSLKEDLVSLRKEFAKEESLHFRQGNPRYITEYSEAQYKEFESIILSRIDFMDTDASSHFWKSIRKFMTQYGFGREWKVPFVEFILTGAYHLPNTNYLLDYDEEDPHNVSIVVGQHTTPTDMRDALSKAKKLLPRAPRQYAGSYSDTEDPEFIDLLKKTETPYFHKEQLTRYEESFYKPDNLMKSAKEIHENRKIQKAGGGREEAKKPKFRKMSDKDFFVRKGLKGKATQKAAETLKKQRQRLK